MPYTLDELEATTRRLMGILERAPGEGPPIGRAYEAASFASGWAATARVGILPFLADEDAEWLVPAAALQFSGNRYAEAYVESLECEEDADGELVTRLEHTCAAPLQMLLMTLPQPIVGKWALTWQTYADCGHPCALLLELIDLPRHERGGVIADTIGIPIWGEPEYPEGAEPIGGE